MSKEATTLEQLLSDLETFLKDTVVKSGLPWDSADSQTMDEDTSADRIPNSMKENRALVHERVLTLGMF